MKTRQLYVYRGEEFVRVLRESAASPTGYRSTTGAFPTAEQAMDAMAESNGAHDGVRRAGAPRMRFLDLETGELLREASWAGTPSVDKSSRHVYNKVVARGRAGGAEA